MKLRFTPRAVENIAAIADYLRAHSPAASQQVRAAIYGSLQDLILFPYAGRIQTDGVRKLVTRKYAYLVYYIVDDAANETVILNVKHPAHYSGYEDA